MSRLLETCLTIGLLCWLSGALQSGVDAAQSNYQIKGRPVGDFVGALGQLHKFLSAKFTPEERCQRQAIVLTTVNQAQTNQFQIADIALGRKEEIEKKYNEINAELMRDLYINASRQYLERQQVDSSFIEVLACLRAGFRNRDAKTRSFLNEKELNSAIEQFDAISKQPLRVLIDGDGKRTGLDMNQLDESVRNSIGNWVGSDEQKMKKLFSVDKPAKEKESEHERDGHQNERAQQTMAIAEATTHEQAQMDEEEQDFMETLFGSLIAVYESLAGRTEINDRCHAYNKLIQAGKDDIFPDEFVDQLVKEVSDNVQRGLKQADLIPDEQTREDFLFIVEMFDPLHAGPETWLDLNECLLKWVNEDESTARYLENPNHVELVNQVISQLDEHYTYAYAQASGADVVGH